MGSDREVRWVTVTDSQAPCAARNGDAHDAPAARAQRLWLAERRAQMHPVAHGSRAGKRGVLTRGAVEEATGARGGVLDERGDAGVSVRAERVQRAWALNGVLLGL